ncbi:MAG: 5'/3'-nucleotidase SurE [Halanaerobiaceae bacterium]
MKILLTNDDGIYADGIQILAEKLYKKNHEICIAAPDRERSAAGHSITIVNPIRAKKIIIPHKDISAYKITGTPADCVKLGIEKISPFKPDLVISGINTGPNLGYDVLYSGTVSAAIEAWMVGYHSIAVSLAIKMEKNFSTAADYIANFIEEHKWKKDEKTLLLNINIPDVNKDKIAGIKITELGTSLYEDTFEERIDPSGNKYYWLTGGNGREEKSIKTDIWAIKNNYVSITPLKVNLNDYDIIKELKQENK